MRRFLVELHYPLFTDEVRELIREIRRRNPGCSDIDDVVIDELWQAFSDDLSHLNEKASKGVESEAALAVEGLLTPSGREAIRAYIDRALDYDAELTDMEDDDLQTLYEATKGPLDEAERAKKAKRGAENDRWAFFAEPEAAADFDFWRTATAWTPEEAVALSLGKDPRVVNREALKAYPVGGSPFRDTFGTRIDLVERAVRVGDLANPMKRSDFLDWARRHGMEYPPELNTTERYNPLVAAKMGLMATSQHDQSQGSEVSSKSSVSDDLAENDVEHLGSDCDALVAQIRRLKKENST